jgi:hypothetical protein
MKKHSRLAGLGLALTLLFGAAFKCGTPNTGGGGNEGNRTPVTSSALKLGEYACYGSGGRIMIGLGFKVLPGNRYTDLDNRESGTFSITGDGVTFHGGHLDGQTGRNLRNYKFTIGAQADCEPF